MRSTSSWKNFTFPLLLQWEMSAATPGVLTMSNKDKCSIFPDSLRRRDMGCPMPPAAPTTVTWQQQQRTKMRQGRAAEGSTKCGDNGIKTRPEHLWLGELRNDGATGSGVFTALQPCYVYSRHAIDLSLRPKAVAYVEPAGATAGGAPHYKTASSGLGERTHIPRHTNKQHTLFCARAVPVKERAADTPMAFDAIGAAILDAI